MNNINVDNIIFIELLNRFLDKYSANDEDMKNELNLYLRENQDTLLKIIKLDEFPLTDLAKQNFVTSIQLTNNPLEVNDSLEDFMINKIFNLNLDKKEEAENSPCINIYYDIQRMHCIGCGKEALYDLTTQAIEALNIKENEIIFCVNNHNSLKENN